MAPKIATLDTVSHADEDAPAAAASEVSISERVRQLPPASPSEPAIYWEYQRREDRMCGLHSINSLLQGPEFTEIDLSTIALYLDEEERKLLYAASTSNSEVSELLAGGSTNVADDGFFSVSVLEECLKRHNISIIPIAAVLHSAVFDPTEAEAFVCHHHGHWFTIRKLHGTWYNLDSLKPAPTRIGDVGLGVFLHHLTEQGYSVFIITSAAPDEPLPLPHDFHRPLNSNQFYLTDKQIDALIQLDKQFHQKALEAETIKYGDGKPSAATAGAHSWPSGAGRRINEAEMLQGPSVSFDVDDPNLAEAIKLSLAEFVNTLPRPPEEPNSDAPNAITIQIRLPTQAKLVRRFQDQDPVKSVFHWLETEVQAVITANTSYQLVAYYPKRILRRMDREHVEYQSGDDQIDTDIADKHLTDVVASKQDMFMLQVI